MKWTKLDIYHYNTFQSPIKGVTDIYLDDLDNMDILNITQEMNLTNDDIYIDGIKAKSIEYEIGVSTRYIGKQTMHLIVNEYIKGVSQHEQSV